MDTHIIVDNLREKKNLKNSRSPLAELKANKWLIIER